MIPNFIIPSEYEMLDALSKNAGVAVVWIVMLSFIQDKKLKIVWDSKQMPHTEVFYYRAKWQSYQRFSEIAEELYWSDYFL
jgi:hypothetical protein